MARTTQVQENSLVSTLDAATILQVSPKTVQRWVDVGELPAHKTAGGHRRILESDLLAYIGRHRYPAPAIQKESHRIVIVDDVVDYLEIAEDLLLGIDPTLTIYKAEGGFLAGALIAKYRPQLVLLDILMPGLHGISVCRWIKSNDTTKNTHVVGVTSAQSQANHEAMLEAGADKIVLKPLKKEVLEDILSRYVFNTRLDVIPPA